MTDEKHDDFAASSQNSGEHISQEKIEEQAAAGGLTDWGDDGGGDTTDAADAGR